MKNLFLTFLFLGLSFLSLPKSQAACSGCPPTAICEFCPETLPYMPYYSPYVNPNVPYCPQCAAAAAAAAQQAMMFPSYYPYPNYVQPFANNYWNFYAPGPYNGMGINPTFFPQTNIPGGGGVMLDKPVVYVEGPDHTKVSIQVEMKAKGEIIATVPGLDENSHWSGEIVKNKFKTSDSTYDYFFYDARADEEKLQDKAGICGTREEALDYMTDGLRTRSFPEDSVREFKMTWSNKLPWNQNLCVYPQSEKELQNVVKLTIEPKNAQLAQLEFIIVPQIYLGSKYAVKPKFSKPPTSDYTFAPVERKIASQTVHLYDWGVGFLVVNKEIDQKKKK